jgi:hypothetical protein
MELTFILVAALILVVLVGLFIWIKNMNSEDIDTLFPQMPTEDLDDLLISNKNTVREKNKGWKSTGKKYVSTDREFLEKKKDQKSYAQSDNDIAMYMAAAMFHNDPSIPYIPPIVESFGNGGSFGGGGASGSWDEPSSSSSSDSWSDSSSDSGGGDD